MDASSDEQKSEKFLLMSQRKMMIQEDHIHISTVVWENSSLIYLHFNLVQEFLQYDLQQNLKANVEEGPNPEIEKTIKSLELNKENLGFVISGWSQPM